MDSMPIKSPVGLNETEMAALVEQIGALAQRLSDSQILEVADLFHQRLRERRELRARLHAYWESHLQETATETTPRFPAE